MAGLNIKTVVLTFVSVCMLCGALSARDLPKAAPENVGMDGRKMANADMVIAQSIAKGDIPGAVLAVVRHGKIAWLKAYGNRQVYPDTLPMQTNTVFDLASVTKPTATAISAMILIEQGKLRLTDDVAAYIPGFKPWVDSSGENERAIRIVDLMTHTSGLPAYAPVDKLKKEYGCPSPEGLMAYICDVARKQPGTSMTYSCLNFITLQHVIENITGESLRDFARQNIFDPLGMSHTDFKPEGETLAMTAPTTRQDDGSVLLGQVHDPLAGVLNGGVSGNAGLFSNAEDLALLAAMLLNEGEINGVRILSPLTVRTMAGIPDGFEKFGRALGWDVCSGYAKDGDLFPESAYGHTGYTGTSITIDPATDTAVILLTNRVHPVDKGSVSRLRNAIANVVAASIVEL